MASALCHKCSTLRFYDLFNDDVVFHPDLNALVQSAKKCEGCNLWWTQVQRDCSKEDIAACLAKKLPANAIKSSNNGDFNIYLRGEWHPAGTASVPDQIWLSCGVLVSVVDHAATKLQTHLAVFADPATPAGALFAGRYSTSARNPEYYATFAKGTLKACRNTHGVCNQASPPGARQMPTRVIDVGDQALPAAKRITRIVLTKDLKQPQPYTALSYCWGKGTQAKLNDENLAEFTKILPESKLSKTHTEAIDLTRLLGIRYLWIDALCIIQGNTKDWESESKRMASVYGNAELTIIAGRSADSGLGFVTNDYPTTKKLPKPVPMKAGPNPHTGDGPDLGSVYLTIQRGKSVGPVDTRGWCFQEALLSNRSLIFGQDQVAYQCRSHTRYEDGCVDVDTSKREQSLTSLNPGTKPEVLRRWYQMLNSFTPRALTEPHDIFPCIVSVAMITHGVLKARYLAGIWECDMPRGLLWKSRWSYTSRRHFLPIEKPLASPFTKRAGETPGKPVIRAPSWSWAHVTGEVFWDTNPRIESKWIDAKNVHIEPRDQQGLWTTAKGVGNPDVLYMSALELQIRGKAVQVRCTNVLKKRTPLTPEGIMMESIKSTPSAKPAPAPTGTAKPNYIALGYFDFPGDPRPPNIWCLLVVVHEGLLLTRDGKGKFHRVGWFAVQDGKQFDGVKDMAVDLV
ncbi:heterokaryon incompatibility protein-domain-containing protein [Pseudoneurospora amorphoporcata]|uniref:Heterokaryon incompatibility protein-domain-containing protein n=1 Tax=Pseudoneurospora amorphoporcata TaxID=241081 RepID=A0AAN6NXS0_9PEZI|nr:heterokaryon incompatibility protein-domain-containing protein [Pseudoneurospora amorphoporcata]